MLLNFDQFSEYLVLLASTSVLAMALIEAAKGILDARLRYHRYATRNWIGLYKSNLLNSKYSLLGSTSSTALTSDGEKFFHQLEYLMVGGKCDPEKQSVTPINGRLGGFGFGLDSDQAFYALPLPKLVAKYQSAFETAIHAPDKYDQLFDFIATGLAASDINKWRRMLSADMDQMPDPASHRQVYDLLFNNLQRKLDSMQIVVEYAWGRINRFAALILGMIILFMILSIKENVSIDPMNFDFWQLLAKAALGGVLAPVAKNLLKALNRIKNRDFDE